MKKVSLVILVLSLCLHFCVGGNKSEQKDKKKSPVSTGAIHKEYTEDNDQLIIKSVGYNLETLNSETDLIATPVMQNQGIEDVQFQFRWFVNNQEITEIGDNILEKYLFKKNDWIYCLIKAVKGDRVSATFRGNYIRIPNSPPVVTFAPIPKFAVPGIFSYQIQAVDIDQDELTYRILAPLDQGINIDEKKGLITWNIDKKIAENYSSAPVKITYEVIDTDGAKAYSTVTITFAEKKIL
ncbi:MAG: hypothetical protein ABII93_00875 [Chrysiogenia bacterium]